MIYFLANKYKEQLFNQYKFCDFSNNNLVEIDQSQNCQQNDQIVTISNENKLCDQDQDKDLNEGSNID